LLMKYWVGLTNSADQHALRRGANNLVVLAMEAREASPSPCSVWVFWVPESLHLGSCGWWSKY
jgi:hypothetical protein